LIGTSSTQRDPIERALKAATARYAGAHPRFRWYARLKYRMDPCYRAIARRVHRDSFTVDLGTGLGMLPVLLGELGEGRRVLGVDWDPGKMLCGLQAARGLPAVEMVEGDLHVTPLLACDVISGNRTVLSEGYAGEEGIAWSPKGEEVLFSAQITSVAGGSALTIYAVTLSGKRRVALESAGGLTIQDVSRDGRWLVTRDDSLLRLIARAPDEKQERDLSWLDGSINPELSRDGRTLLFMDQSWTGGPNYTVCLRKTDGSPVVRLGEGRGCGLSPDGAWALAIVPTTPQQLRLYPTGPGQPRTLERGNLESYETAVWFQDGTAILACGNEPGHARRCYTQEIAGGHPRPVTPEGTSVGRPSPDGKIVLAVASGKTFLFPVAGGAPRPLPEVASEDQVLRWSPDGRSLWLRRSRSLPIRIDRLDLETLHSELLVEIAPRDPAGLLVVRRVSLADDPGSYVYDSLQYLSHLFVVEGAP
jgi:Tol biopolymer transport system component